MPLVNFKTDLTTLKYGKDKPGGGYSGQPYMQFPIENVNTPAKLKAYYEANRTSLDFPVRGGLITQLVTGEGAIISSGLDRERIQKFFKDAPRGKAFIEKQIGLQLTNPRTQVPNSLTFAGLGLGNAVLPVTNVYTPLNSLFQVQSQGTGAHFNRHGVVPTIYESVKQTYEYIAGAPQNNTEITNRLAILKALKLLDSTNFLVDPAKVGGRGISPVLVDRLGISPVRNQLFNYQGGPGSVYGLGFTRIFRDSDTNATNLLYTSTKGFTVGGDPTPNNIVKPYSAIALTYQQLAEQNTRKTNPESPVQARVQDFRLQLPKGTTPRSDYEKSNLNTRFGVGNPGQPNARVRYNDIASAGSANGVDQINVGKPFYYNPDQADPWTAGKDQTEKRWTEDIIKFAFECLDNNNIGQSAALIFRAFLEGQITDNNSAEYNSFKYLGRGETFRTYQGFDRSISFSFKVFVQSRQEMRPLYMKLNQLISQVYPDYSPEYNLMRGNVVRLTIGDYIYRMPGFLENVNVTIDNTSTPWEIALNEVFTENQPLPTDIDVRQLPHMVSVQCNFKPIMDLLPRKTDYSNQFVPLIVNKDHYLDPEASTLTDAAKLL